MTLFQKTKKNYKMVSSLLDNTFAFIRTLIIVSLLSACGITLKSAKKQFSEIHVTPYTNLDSAIASKKEALLFLIFNDGDVSAYNSPITKTLKIDTIKEDASIYRVLARDFAVLKLYNNEYRLLLNNLDDSTKAEALKYNPNKAFMFISVPQKKFDLYGKRTLDSPKADINDLIWVKFGP